MGAFFEKLTRARPTWPRYRYGIYAGTNSWAEARSVWLQPPTADAVIRYEREFAARCGAAFGVGFAAGRMALYAILEALDIGPGDEVIIPAFTCVVVPNAILYRGARPVYADIDSRSFNISIAGVKAAITPRTKALYAQHTFGRLCDVDALKSLATAHGLPVIEDGAHALGTSHRGRPVGSLTEVAFFSTDHSKVINTHMGGMAVTNDEEIARRLRVVQEQAPPLTPGQIRRLKFSLVAERALLTPSLLWIGSTVHRLLARTPWFFAFRDDLKTVKPPDYPRQLSPMQAMVGLSQLVSLAANLEHRRRIASWLEAELAWQRIEAGEIQTTSWLRYSFLVRDRAEFEACFRRRFDLGIWFTTVLSGRQAHWEEVAYVVGSCPVAEFVARHIVNFPTHPLVSLEHLREEVARHRRFLNENLLTVP